MKSSSAPLLGIILTQDSPAIAELVANLGYDWVMIDMEHSTLDLQACQRLLQAIAGRCETIVRVPSDDEVWIKRILDTGCDGIMVPQVNSATIAQRVVRASKYPPVGTRSVGIGRAHGYGQSFASYLAQANTHVKVMVQIEHILAVEALDEIMSTPGIDSIFIGPNDLSGSMGLPGQVQHPDVQAAIKKVKEACIAKGKPYGIFGGTPEAIRPHLADGCRYALIGMDMMVLGNALKSNLEGLNKP